MPNPPKISPAETAPAPKFGHPKIILIDVESNAAEALRRAGYNVTEGSFGAVFTVKKSGGFMPVIPNGNRLPHFTEQEIVVIDLGRQKSMPYPQAAAPSQGVRILWECCEHGTIDRRPSLMATVSNQFDRILKHGGLFVVVAAPRCRVEYVSGKASYDNVVEQSGVSADNWSFLGALSEDFLVVEPDRGTEIVASDTDGAVVRLLEQHASGGTFECTLRPTPTLNDIWISLLQNKYGDAVAGFIALDDNSTILIVPRLTNFPEFLLSLLTDVFPVWSPKLFPHIEGPRWTERPEYELPGVVQIQTEIQEIKAKANAAINSLEQKIAECRHASGWQHDLLTGTGDVLVAAVQQALRTLGFSRVVNVDELLATSEESGDKREDLRILDKSPSLLVEVKGINGLPKEAAALQVWKYLAPRMKEWQRTDIQGLSIVNHQRHIPALERDNANVFRPDILSNAEQQCFGLMTAWDLFRLVRSFVRNSWTHDQILDVFYRVGRIQPVPDHYEYVGSIEHFWPKPQAVGVRVSGGTLRGGDRVAFEFPIEFVEQQVDRIEIDNQQVAEGPAGSLAAFKTLWSQVEMRKGMRVFRINLPSPAGSATTSATPSLQPP